MKGYLILAKKLGLVLQICGLSMESLLIIVTWSLV